MHQLGGLILLRLKRRVSTIWGLFHHYWLKPPLARMIRRHNVKFGQGAGVDPLVREQFEERFGVPLVEAWGMTETSRAIQNCGIPRCLEPRAFGRPRLPLEVLVVDDDDKALPFNSPGELLIRAVGL